MKRLIALTTCCLLAFTLLTVHAEDAKKTKKAGPKCPVSGQPIDKEHKVVHNGGEVYFCCPKCPPVFEKNPDKFAAKANHQLVQTKQAKQVKCPLTGGPTKDDKVVKVAGVKVNFCCGNCLAKADGLKGAKRMKLLFNDEAFKKGFKVSDAK